MNIYIHIPFCHQKCHYCYYYSFVPRERKVVDEYLDYLEKEFQLKNQKFKIKKNDKVETIYIGGGTPNYLSDSQLEKLFLILKKYFNVALAKEVVIEMNPAACDLNQLKILKKNGVTRLSFGLQTLNVNILKKINRYHVDNYSEIIQTASRLGFAINLDFMLGLPGQTIKDAEEAVQFVKEIKPESSFWCELRLGTREIKEHADIPAHKKTVKMYEFVKENLLKNGYRQIIPEYFSCKKTLPLYLENWWTSQKSLGFGLSAFSKINNVFYKNTDNYEKYANLLKVEKMPIRYLYKFSKKEEALVDIISQLKNGVADLTVIKKKLKFDVEKYLALEIKKLVLSKLIIFKKGKIIFTEKGFTISSPVSNLLIHKNEHLAKIIDTAFNFIDNMPNLEELIRKHFVILKEEKGGKIIFTSPDRESVGIIEKYEKK